MVNTVKEALLFPRLLLHGSTTKKVWSTSFIWTEALQSPNTDKQILHTCMIIRS